jgi:peptidoglycan hydrolase-like protein with peptidoglycan-binding domain
MNKFVTTACAIAVALAWSAGPALAADETVKDKAESTKDTLKDKGEKAKDTLQTTGENTKDKLQTAGEKGKDKSEGVLDKTKEKAAEVKDKIKGAFHRDKNKVADHTAAGAADVRTAQQSLKDKGYDPGPIDGKMGMRTRTALRDFQKKEGLKATGRLDSETVAHLNGTSSGTASSPSATTSPSASPSTTAPPAASPSNRTEPVTPPPPSAPPATTK